MEELHPELVSLVPERCRDCALFTLLIRILGNKLLEGSIALEDAVAAVVRLKDDDCEGPGESEDHGGMCHQPNCSHSKNTESTQHLRTATRVINTEGLQALEI